LGPLPGSVTADGAVHGRPGDAEQVADLGGAVLARLQQRDQMRFLPRVELGLLAPEPAFGLDDANAFLVRKRMRSAPNSATIAST
jgi:hypothetical protein